MFIELAEALDCPECQGEVGLVAFVRDLQDRRVVEGHLGCPQCGVEYAIRGGAIDLGRDRGESSDSRRPAPATAGDPCPQERAMQVAALLGVQERADARMLLDEGLAACAEPVAGWGERVEVLALVSDPAATEPRPGVTPIAGASRTPWPFRPRSLQGVAMLGGSPERLGEAERILAPGGRLAVFEPEPEVLEAIEGLDFEIQAAEAFALVATRR